MDGARKGTSGLCVAAVPAPGTSARHVQSSTAPSPVTTSHATGPARQDGTGPSSTSGSDGTVLVQSSLRAARLQPPQGPADSPRPSRSGDARCRGQCRRAQKNPTFEQRKQGHRPWPAGQPHHPRPPPTATSGVIDTHAVGRSKQICPGDPEFGGAEGPQATGDWRLATGGKGRQGRAGQRPGRTGFGGGTDVVPRTVSTTGMSSVERGQRVAGQTGRRW